MKRSQVLKAEWTLFYKKKKRDKKNGKKKKVKKKVSKISR